MGVIASDRARHPDRSHGRLRGDRNELGAACAIGAGIACAGITRAGIARKSSGADNACTRIFGAGNACTRIFGAGNAWSGIAGIAWSGIGVGGAGVELACAELAGCGRCGAG